MSATTWFIIAIVGFSLSGIAFVAAIFMFIKMNIPAIIGDLSGKTVAREIKAMREANISSGDKRFRSSKVNLERGTLTEKVEQPALDAEALKKAHASKRLDKTTGSLGSTATDVLSDSNATEILSSNATEVLDSNATEVLKSDGTEVLSDCGKIDEGTTVLSYTEELTDVIEDPVAFKVIRSELIVHSDEVI